MRFGFAALLFRCGPSWFCEAIEESWLIKFDVSALSAPTNCPGLRLPRTKRSLPETCPAVLSPRVVIPATPPMPAPSPLLPPGAKPLAVGEKLEPSERAPKAPLLPELALC